MQSSLLYKRLTNHLSYLLGVIALLLVGFFLNSCGSPVTAPPPNAGGSTQVEVNETSSSTDTVAEPIYLNNCGNSAESEQTSEHSQSISIEGGAEIGASAEVVQASISAKYVSTKGVSISQKVIASPGTNMKFVLLWTEQVNSGTVTVINQSGQATYRVMVPISVEQASADDLGCGNSQSPAQPANPPDNSSNYHQISSNTSSNSSSNPSPIPTTIVEVPTEPPLGNAIIGALNNDGTAAINTSNVGLYPKTHLDATGAYVAISSDYIWVVPETGTGITTFNGLQPGDYVVCFGYLGSWVREGLITIKPYKTIRQNFRWPPSLETGSTCKLN